MKYKLFLGLVFLLVLPFISAVVYEQSTDFNLTVICTNNGTYCSSVALCNGTLINPLGVAVINNEVMVRNGAIFSLDVNSTQSSELGEYQLNSICVDSKLAKSETWFFDITPNGELPTIVTGLLYVGLIFMILCFLGLLIYGFIISESLLAKFTLFHLGYLIFTLLLFICWNLSLDYFMGITFLIAFFNILWLVFMIGWFPLLLVSFVWVGYMMLTIKEIKGLMERGLSEDDAMARIGGKRQ